MQMIKQPKVTAGILCYNEARFLRQCFRSLMSQTYNNIEIVISDNNSSDDSKRLF